MVRRLSRPHNWSQLTTGGGTHHLRYLDNPCMPGSPLQLGNPGSSAPSILQISGHLPSAHILPAPANSPPLQTVFHVALIFTKLFLMLEPKLNRAYPYYREKAEESPSIMAVCPAGPVLALSSSLRDSAPATPDPGHG